MEAGHRARTTTAHETGGLLLGAAPPRAFVEAVTLAAILALPFLLLGGRTTAGDLTFGLVVGPLCAMLFAARARLRAGGRRGTILLREAGVGAIFSASAAAVGASPTTSGSADPVALMVALFVWDLGAFTFFRSLAYLWPRWVVLRRSRLRWDMTHATLLVVATVSVVVILAAVSVSLATGGVLYDGARDLSLDQRLLEALFVLGNAVFFAVVALAFVLPPAAIISYFAAKRTARRLESLARAAAGLKEKNLAVRVPVDGEDEISVLQRSFNEMAEDLEKAVQDLRHERDNVGRLLEAQRELVASVSHELRTPVATMRGYLESALDGHEEEAPLPPTLRDDLEVMGREVIRLQRLTEDLFTLSRAESGRLPLEVGPTDVAPLLGRCVGAVAGSAWRTGKVEVVASPTDPDLPEVLADEGRLEQAVRNLLQNAIRHTLPGGVVALGAAADADAVVIEVKDTGEGIPPEDLERVFERFWRSEGARRTDHTGAGLGLALVKELAEAMGGGVSVESEPGAGSRFLLHLSRA